MDSYVRFGKPVEGVWLKRDDGEICIFSDETTKTFTVGRYENKEKPIMTKCVTFDDNGKVTVQLITNKGDLAHVDVSPEKVSDLLSRFLDSVAGIYQ